MRVCAMRWFDWIRPDRCEIPGCDQQPQQSSYLGGARLWLCDRHAEELGARPLIKTGGRKKPA